MKDDYKISGKDIYARVGVKTPFRKWVKRCIDYADLKEGKDFWTVLSESIGGRKATEYEFTKEAAMEMCLVSATPMAKEFRRELIELKGKRENLEYLNINEWGEAYRTANSMKYVSNQKEALAMHQKHYVETNTGNPKYMYADFAKHRANIVGWDKAKVDKALAKYLITNVSHDNVRLGKQNMQIKLSVIDVGEAIRISVLDALYAKDTDPNLAHSFANVCKAIADEIGIKGEQDNNADLLKEKDETLPNVRQLSLNPVEK